MSQTIDELKQKYGTVYTLTVPINDDETEHATFYLRKLDRTTYSAVSKVIQKDELMATEIMLKALHIGGDDLKIIDGNFDALRSASIALVEMITTKQATLKKN